MQRSDLGQAEDHGETSSSHLETSAVEDGGGRGEGWHLGSSCRISRCDCWNTVAVKDALRLSEMLLQSGSRKTESKFRTKILK